jgi:hypothetical protein
MSLLSWFSLERFSFDIFIFKVWFLDTIFDDPSQPPLGVIMM